MRKLSLIKNILSYNGKNYKLPTQAGKEIGILVEYKNGMYGEYPLTLYTIDAQRFMIDNIRGLIKVIS